MPWSIDFKARKWAMMGHKGGKCMICGELVTDKNYKLFHFDHKIKVNNGTDKRDRWGGGIRLMTPFIDAWFAWAKTVDLVCEDCHRGKHKRLSRQLSFEEFEQVQKRLEKHQCENMTVQSDLNFEAD